MKKVLKVIISIIVVVALLAGAGMFFITRGLKEGAELVINDINPSVLEDGKYNGSYKSGRFSSQVEVVIKEQKIADIQLISEPMGKPGEATDTISPELFKRVIEKQTPNVDVMSGATVTSKAYLKSIENALIKK